MSHALRSVLALGLVAGLAGIAPAGTITGDYVEARTCDVYTGPCFANCEFGLTGDQAVMAWSITRGDYQGVDLSGLTVVAAVKAADTLGDEFTHPFPAKSVLIVDERGTPEQQAALVSFARAMGGKLLESVTRVDTAPIEMRVRCCENRGCAKLVAGRLVTLETRCPNDRDHVCGNESVYYQPLTNVDRNFVPAVTVSHAFQGKGLGGTWSSPNKRSAFIASFTR